MDEVIEPKGIERDCASKANKFVLVELSAVSGVAECNVYFENVDTREEDAYPLVETFGCGWFVVFISVVSNTSVAYDFGVSVSVMLSKLKAKSILRENQSIVPFFINDQKYQRDINSVYNVINFYETRNAYWHI